MAEEAVWITNNCIYSHAHYRLVGVMVTTIN